MKIIKKYDFAAFEPWSGAVGRWEILRDAEKLGELEIYLEEVFEGSEADEGAVNDFIWFEFDDICRAIFDRSEEWIVKHEEKIRAGLDPDEIDDEEAGQ